MDANVGGAGVLALPDDVQVDILRRLRAHSLARCRCVCAPWRGLVDARGLLFVVRPHALLRAFPGFFANTVVRAEPWKPGPAFLPPPASRAGPAAVDDRLAFLRPHLSSRGGGEAVVVRDQCDGLLLCFQQGGGRSGEDADAAAGFVCNPTTQRWGRLPPPPTPWPRGRDGLFLAFDPAVSPEYEVFLLPVPPRRGQRNGDSSSSSLHEVLGRVTLGMFVPESFGKQREAEPEEDEKKMLPLLVFSSANGRWRRRLFAPGRHAPARLFDKVTRRRRRRTTSDPDAWPRTWRSAVYRRGTLYALCEKRVVVALRCAEGTYDMVRLPAGAAVADATGRYATEHVLSSLPADAIFSSTDEDDGALLRYASVDAFRVKVWALRGDGDGQLSWALTHDTDLAAHARMLPLLHDAPSNRARWPEEGAGAGKCVWFPDEDAAGGDACGRRWNWDDAGLFDMEVGEGELLGGGDAAACSPSPFAVLGCHPSREVVYLASGAFHVVACHLGCPGKVRYLGRVLSLGDGDRLDGVFAYRPCIVDALPRYSCPFPSLKTVTKSH